MSGGRCPLPIQSPATLATYVHACMGPVRTTSCMRTSAELAVSTHQSALPALQSCAGGCDHGSLCPALARHACPAYLTPVASRQRGRQGIASRPNAVLVRPTPPLDRHCGMCPRTQPVGPPYHFVGLDLLPPSQIK